jgi:hypothetical protein
MRRTQAVNILQCGSMLQLTYPANNAGGFSLNEMDVSPRKGPKLAQASAATRQVGAAPTSGLYITKLGITLATVSASIAGWYAIAAGDESDVADAQPTAPVEVRVAFADTPTPHPTATPVPTNTPVPATRGVAATAVVTRATQVPTIAPSRAPVATDRPTPVPMPTRAVPRARTTTRSSK